MRAPFQILAIPYKIVDKEPLFCVFHRSNSDMWQFIAGGGEDEEMPHEAAKREIWEESGMVADELFPLKSLCFIPTNIYPEQCRRNWPEDTYVIPEYAFAFHCESEIRLSHEHDTYAWMTEKEARKKLKWDSNKTALYELKCRLEYKRTENEEI